MTLKLRSRARILMCCFVALISTTTKAQVQTARAGVRITSNLGGFYEYLPQGYSSGSASYPLLVFLHGVGELGNGDDDLPLVLRNGPPRLINQNQFPTSFTVNGQTFRFIVISPQFQQFPSTSDIGAMIDYAIAHYRVDPNRIYLTGLSMGGGLVWEYAGISLTTARKLAAIVPICGASFPYGNLTRNMADADLPVWATHNNPDPTVPYSNSVAYVNGINQSPSPPTPLARLLTSPGGSTGHDAWTATYNPNSTLFDGGNIYSWMLQFSRAANIPLPVSITNYTATAANGKVSVNWTTTFEQNNDHFSIERSSDGLNFTNLGEVKSGNQSSGQSYTFEDQTPLPGNNFYRLSQTDIDGKITYFEIKNVNLGALADKTVKLFPNPANEKITIEMQNSVKGKISVSILNTSGKKVKTIEITKRTDYTQQTILLNGLAAGYYILEIKADNYSYSASFIKK
jgi:poly(3-hydroxybutyrate) depolymerase